MATFTFADSQYRFIEPVRFFKANDPYYWEVDNIPLKQLQENCLWLRDQIQKASSSSGGGPGTTGDIKRSDFDELKPYATGSDRIIRVRPGRFTARINDIGSNPLAQYIESPSDSVPNTDTFTIYNGNNTSNTLNQIVYNSLEKFKSILGQNAQNLNGLTERTFTRAIQDLNTPSQYALTTSDALSYTFPGGSILSPFVYSQVIFPWVTSLVDAYYSVKDYDDAATTIGFNKLPLLESVFIKRWRGVARTAIVDVPSELSVEVPIFDGNDFYYYDSNGNKVIQASAGRIDLVFIYSKPVDASSSTVFKNGSVTQITEPVLGIVRGAGLGPVLTPLPNQAFGTASVVTTAFDSAGNPRIQAHAADAEQTGTIGFLSSSGTGQVSTVKGSFPSPDDLLNLSPLICNELESNAIELVGQSILPVAYVFVPSVPTVVAGIDVVDIEDVIDIRPFFRTAELSYNERAGIAAAIPQISLANPVVGKAELNREIWKISKYLEDRIEQNNQVGDSFNPPFIAAAGYIFGGWQYGPEAVILKHEALKGGVGTTTAESEINTIKQRIATTYGFGLAGLDFSGFQKIPDMPQWEIADWATTLPDSGNYPYDRLYVAINKAVGSPNSDNMSTGSYTESFIRAGSNTRKYNVQFPNLWLGDGQSHAQHIWAHGGSISTSNRTNFFTFYVKKTINFSRPSNLEDFDIEIDYINCSMIRSGIFTDRESNYMRARLRSHWIEKSESSFTIYVPIDVAYDPTDSFVNAVTLPINVREQVSNSGRVGFEGVVVIIRDFKEYTSSVTTTNSFSASKFGVCTYPTIRWRMIATRKQTLTSQFSLPGVDGGSGPISLYWPSTT